MSDASSEDVRRQVDEKLSSWFQNPEEAYELEAVREMHRGAI